MIKKIFLDLDGPLLDGKDRHYLCYSDIIAEQGCIPLKKEQYWAMKRERLELDKLLQASRAESLVDMFLAAWCERIESRHYLAMDRLQPSAVDVLMEWKRDGIEIILLTLRNQRDNLLWQLHELGLTHLFFSVLSIGSNERQLGKALAATPFMEHLSTQEALWIGDTELDIKAARMLGMRVCAVSCGLRTPELLAAEEPDMIRADLVSINLKEL